MVTYLELNGEPWWDREYVPPSLDALADALRAHFNVGPTLIGCKGDNNHLRGYHRSDEWLANSTFCTNRTYSRSETPGNRDPGSVRWICAIDIGGMPRSELIEMCRRVDEAVRSGRYEKVTEWYGNLGGDLRVDGYNNIVNRLATSDSSHLSHLHLSFDRARVGEDHSDLLAVLIGDDVSAQDVWDYRLPNPAVLVDGKPRMDPARDFLTYGNNYAAAAAAKAAEAVQLLQEVKALLAAAPPGGLTEQQVEDAAFRGAQRAEDA